MKRKKAKVIYISHGGGPLPLLEDPGHKKMISFMKNITEHTMRPKEILVISAHWEETSPTVIGSGVHKLFYDYYGFPEETYNIKYPAKGSPGLVNSIMKLLDNSGFKPVLNMERGLDHGVFIPLKMIYPDAEIPVTQLSLLQGLDPEKHILLGKSLGPLLDTNILIIGSGFSYHNISRFSVEPVNLEDHLNNQFQDWLIDVCTNTDNYEERLLKLKNWEKAPNARYCHPREEHLLPLLVCAAASGTTASVIFDDYIIGKRSVAFKWQ